MMVKVPNIFHRTWCWIAKRRWWLALECAKISGEHHSMKNFQHESLTEHIHLQLGKRKKNRILANPVDRAIRGSSLGWSMEQGSLILPSWEAKSTQAMPHCPANKALWTIHYPSSLHRPFFRESGNFSKLLHLCHLLTTHSNKMLRPPVQLAHSIN